MVKGREECERGEREKLLIRKGEQMEKIILFEKVRQDLLAGDLQGAKNEILCNYPFKSVKPEKRTYTDKEKMQQFRKDGFIDRYSGQKLLNPGYLRVLSHYMPEEFPYHPHWKMQDCHISYWEFVPTVDHIYPIALGGADSAENRVTTSMLHNSIKNNWTLEQLNWKLHEPGDFTQWDGLTSLFVKLVEADDALLSDPYIRKWYRLAEGGIADDNGKEKTP